jgi:hypothetical protein
MLCIHLIRKQKTMQEDIKFRLVRRGIDGKDYPAGYEMWNPRLVQPRWEYSITGISWSPLEVIPHYKKDRWTGLRDKNEQEIYENDIIKWPIKHKRHPDTFIILPVEWVPCQIKFRPRSSLNPGVEKIGNIYTNKDLLPTHAPYQDK